MDVTRLNEQLNSLERSNQSTLKETDQFKMRLQEKTAEATQIDASLQGAKEEIKGLLEKVRRSEERERESMRSMGQMESKAAGLQDRVDQLEKQLQRLKEESSQSEAKSHQERTIQQSEIHNIQIAMAQQMTENKSLHQQIQEINDSNGRLQQEMEQLIQQYRGGPYCVCVCVCVCVYCVCVLCVHTYIYVCMCLCVL